MSQLRCYTCLQSNRKLSPLKAQVKFLFALLCPEMFLKNKDNAQYLICWECEFMAVKIKRFQTKLKKANEIINLSFKGQTTIIEGLSFLKATSVETISITIPQSTPILPQSTPNLPQSSPILPQSTPILPQNEQKLPLNVPMPIIVPKLPQNILELSLKDMLATPIEMDTVQVKIEKEDEETDSCDEPIQPSIEKEDEETDSCDEPFQPSTILSVPMEESDPLLIPRLKQPAEIELLVPHLNPVKDEIIDPAINYLPQKVFINPPKDEVKLRGFRETVKVTAYDPNLMMATEINPVLMNGDIIPVKSEKSDQLLTKLLTPKREELFFKRQCVPYSPECHTSSRIDRQRDPNLDLPNELELSEQSADAVCGEDDAKLIILDRTEVNADRDRKRSKPAYLASYYKCERCIEWFRSQEKLDEHNMKHDMLRGNSICDICEQRFADNSLRYEHYKQHFITAYNYPMADKPDETMDLTDLPLSSRSNAPVDTQDAAASTSATPFAELPTIAAPKSSAQRQREHRQRIAASRTPAQSTATRISDTERKRNYRLRKAANLALASGSLESTTASSSRSAGRSNDVRNNSQRQLTNHQRQSLAAEPAQTTVQTGTSSDPIEVPDDSVDLTDLPLPSRSNAPVDTQDAAASTSATPSAEPPTIAAPKSSAQRQREYRQRIAASRTPAQSTATRISDTERKRNYRLRKAANLALASGSLESTTASSSRSAGKAGRSNDVQNCTQRPLANQQRQSLAAEPAQTTVQPGTSSDRIEVQQPQSTWNTKWKSAIMRFTSTFLDNDFGYTCSVCDRLWFKNDLKPITAAQLKVISDWFIIENRQLCREEYELVCNTCKRSLNKKSMPPLAKVNGFSYPDRPPDLPPLDPISERLISPRLPFMQVRRLRHDFSCGIIGQVINVPVDVQEMIKFLPRQLNEDDVINVNIKRNLAHKSGYISGYMSKSTIKAWLDVLQKSSLYRLYEINVDLSRLNPTVPLLEDIQDNPSNRIENISAENTPESEILASRQHTMMWNEEDCLHIAPGHQAKPLNIIYDRHAEELSFPSIYFGEPRRFNMGVSLSHYMMAASEIRRRDRRGATPQKILYVAMKLLRLRIVDGIYNTFRNVSVTENVTRRMLEDTEFLKEYVIQNLAFMKTVPNSVQYWASRKRDLFAMIRQLGKPTIFLTISANETRWMKLLTILLKLSNKYPGKTAKDLNTSQRCTLVSDDPVTCCIYFYKLLGSLMKMLKSKQSYNPFGQYSVKDYFLRIEFQHRGDPHAHILLWLNDDPHETVSENMPRTIELVEKLSSVARDDVPNDSVYANQIHKHTFTCTKRGETTCRFGIPHWPMSTTRVLVPMAQSDTRRKILEQKAKELRTSLDERRYTCMDDFLKANSLTYATYLDIVRSTLRRPTLLFRRNFDELMTNTFNPYLAGEVNSNIDIQFILDEYNCAEYVVEYVNKSSRGMGNLRRELTTMMQEHPELDYTGQLKALSIKLLNAVEMSAQEAAWYLLRQPMSETSRDVVYIPTVWPKERQRCRKRRQQMDREGIDGDSTNVWTKNIIQRYEERPASLEQVYLAEFASWYANANDFVDEEDDVPVDDDEDSEGVPEASTLRAPKEYRRRLTGRIIRYRRYNIDETVNYKREMVLLYVQFRNEMSEIVDQNNFLQLFDDHKDTIMERRSLFETNSNIENVMKELEALMILQNEDNSNLQEEESRTALSNGC